MRRCDFYRLRRGDLVRVGKTLRVVQFGPADYRYSDTHPGRAVDFAKLVRTGYPSAATCYFYGDIGRKTTFIKHAPRLLLADLDRIAGLGWNATREIQREWKRWLDWEKLGIGRITSKCRRPR